MLDLHNTHAVQWLGCQYITYPLSGKTYVKTLKWLGNIFRRSSHHLSQKHVTESCDMYHATFMSCVASSLKGQIIHVWHVTKNAHVCKLKCHSAYTLLQLMLRQAGLKGPFLRFLPPLCPPPLPPPPLPLRPPLSLLLSCINHDVEWGGGRWWWCF